MNPALAFANRQHRRELPIAQRQHRSADPIVKHHESLGGPGEQYDMRADRLLPADADVQVARVEAGGLERLHLDDRDILAVARTAPERLTGVRPEIGNLHRFEIGRPLHPRQYLALDDGQLSGRGQAAQLLGNGENRRVVAISQRDAAETGIVEGHPGADRSGAKHIGADWHIGGQ